MKIVIDPGHGGRDPGAVGPCGAMEKAVVLAVARIVQEQLPGSVLTRSDDTYLSLSDRVAMANEESADFFVSIHANSHDSQAEGIETFRHPQGDVRLANAIQRELTGAFLDHKDRGVKTATFQVLRETRMPAALVEMEFLSNETWCPWLSRPSVHQQYADAIVAGIRSVTGQATPVRPSEREAIASDVQDIIGRLAAIKNRIVDAS